MEVVRRPSQFSRPSSALLVASQPEASGEASPVPSWVVPSHTGGATMTTTTSQMTGHNAYTITEGQTVTTTTMGQQQMPAQHAYAVTEGQTVTTLGGQHQFQQNQQYIGGQTTMVTAELASTGGYTTITGSEVRKDSRVVGREYGAQRLVSETRRVDESRQSVISERYVEHEIRIPKKIIREEVIEKVIVIPETVRHEEVIDDVQVVREKIIEVAKPTIVEKVVEIPEIEYVERIVEVPYRVIQEREVAKDVVNRVERVVQKPVDVVKQVVREVPEITYRDVVVDKPVEVVQWKEVTQDKIVPVPTYVDRPVEVIQEVEKVVAVPVQIPVPVEAEVIHEYHLPQIKPRYSKATYPVYLPRFIEVPVATELLRDDLKLRNNAFVGQIGALAGSAASLCEIENLAAQIMKTGDIAAQTSIDVQNAVINAWQSNTLQVCPAGEVQQVVTALPLAGTASSQQFVVSARSPLHADTASKATSKKSKKSSKSDKKN